jgi:hypothetical protein
MVDGLGELVRAINGLPDGSAQKASAARTTSRSMGRASLVTMPLDCRWTMILTRQVALGAERVMQALTRAYACIPYKFKRNGNNALLRVHHNKRYHGSARWATRGR